MIHDDGPRPLIDGEELSWLVRGIAAIVVLPFAALALGALAGIAALGFALVYGG